MNNVYYIYKMKQTWDNSPRKTLRPDIRKQVYSMREKYTKISQIALYSSLQQVGKMGIFTTSLSDVESNVIFCFDATKINKYNQQAMYYMIRTLNEEVPKLKNKFSLAYIHNSLKHYKNFRKYIQYLPQQHLEKFKTLYIINGKKSLTIYSQLLFGSINRYFHENTKYVSSVQQIQQTNKIILGCLKTIKCPQLQVQTSKPPQSLDVEVPSIIKNQLYGRQIWEYELNEFKLPKIIFTMVGTIYSRPQQLLKQGIMRKSCNIEILETLQFAIISEPNPYTFIRKFDDCGVISGCVKKIFNNLNNPLFSYDIYDSILVYQDDGLTEHKIDFLKSCISKMGQINQKVFVFLLAFFLEGIVKHQQSNKMSIYNLAVVFGPCFFRPKTYRVDDLLNSGKFSSFIKLCLQNFEQILGEERATQVYKSLELSKQ